MSNQHHIIKSSHSTRQRFVGCRRWCGRVLNLSVLIFTLSTGLGTAAYADGAQRTRAQAVEIAKAQSGDGRVLSVKKKVDKKGHSVFAVKIIVNGRVKVYAIPEFAN